MLRDIWLAFLLLNAAAVSQGQEIVIEGRGDGYEGVPIQLHVPGNPFLDIPVFSETVEVNRRGAFRMQMPPPRSGVVWISTPQYTGFIHVVSGGRYFLQLPDYSKPRYEQQVSPFFEPEQISFRVRSGEKGGLNRDLFRVDSIFTELNGQVILERRSGRNPAGDSLVRVLEGSFPGKPDPWLARYIRHKSGILMLNAGQTGLEEIGKEYLGEVVREDHPAYLELFGAMFRDFLVYFGRTRTGSGIRHHINRTHSLDSLRRILRRHPAVTSDTLADLLLLQELPSLFYGGDFHKQAILILLDSLAASPSAPRFALYARQMDQKLSSLVIGHPPPALDLPSLNGERFTPEDLLGRYTYLMFCTPDHYGCMMEYPFLQSYTEKHSEYLNVVTVMVADTRPEAAAFMERNRYAWKALWYGGEHSLLRDYMVRAFPVAYLIGPDGNLVLSPAPLPTDGFEQQLFRILRSRGEI